VSSIHWAAKTGVLLVGSRAMMGQLCCADGIVDGVVAVEVGGGMVSQGLGAWGVVWVAAVLRGSAVSLLAALSLSLLWVATSSSSWEASSSSVAVAEQSGQLLAAEIGQFPCSSVGGT